MQVLDPNYKEEAVMGGRMTITMNTHGDVCAVQKGGGVGISQSEIMRCFRVASMKAADITAKLKECVSEFLFPFNFLFMWILFQCLFAVPASVTRSTSNKTKGWKN